MPQIPDTPATVLLAGALLVTVGCGGQTGPDSWNFDDESDRSGAPRSSSDSSSSADAGGSPDPSGAPSVDAGSTPDTSGPRTAEDAGTAPEVAVDVGTDDAGPRTVDRSGWHIGGFERSEFVPQEDVSVEASFDGGDCEVGLAETQRERERWWARWRPDPEPREISLFSRHFSDDRSPSRFERAGYYRVRGRLTSEGEYGHLGKYDRRLTVTEAELDVCRSVSRLAHCAVPTVDGPNCAVLDRRELGRRTDESLEQDRFVRKYLKDDSEAVRYALRVKSNAADSWSFRLSFTSESGPVEASNVSVDNLTGASLSARTGWTPEREYTNLEGWVGRVPETKGEALYVSVSGSLAEDDSGDETSHPSRVHVWGTYTVEEVRESQ